MIVITTTKDYNKNYEIKYEIHQGTKVYVNTIITPDFKEYYKIVNNILDAQIELLKG